MTEDWAFTATDFLRRWGKARGMRLSEMRVPARLAIVFGGADLRSLRARLHATPLRWYPGVYVGRAGRVPVALVRPTIGAPATATTVDEMAVMGAREVLAFGACGSLAEAVRIGSFVIPTRAYAGDGTSRAYGGGRWPRPDRAFAERLRAACERHGTEYHRGGVWTTDAPYRERRSTVRELRKKGVVAVDMEAAAMFAVARERGLRAASLFVVSDELAGARWRPGWWDPAFDQGRRLGWRILVDALSEG